MPIDYAEFTQTLINTGPVTRKRFRLKTLTFLYGYTFRLHENGKNVHENVLTSKMLLKGETFENARNEKQCKRLVNVENVTQKTQTLKIYFIRRCLQQR